MLHTKEAKRKTLETKNIRKLIIGSLFVIPFLTIVDSLWPYVTNRRWFDVHDKTRDVGPFCNDGARKF